MPYHVLSIDIDIDIDTCTNTFETCTNATNTNTNSLRYLASPCEGVFLSAKGEGRYNERSSWS